MIDIHAHILPGLDDGARDIYDTLEMAKMAADCGVRGIIATPHCNIVGLYENYFGEAYKRAFSMAQKAIKEEQIPLTLYPGMEVFATFDLPKLLKEGKIMTQNATGYLLVEFDFEEDPEIADELLEETVKAGVWPVIAHAERYRFIQDNPIQAYEWRKKGYYIQINKGSVTGRFGRHAKNTAYELLDHNLVSVMASDAHRPYQRTTFMLDAIEELSEYYPQDYITMLVKENSRRICEGKRLVELPSLQF